MGDTLDSFASSGQGILDILQNPARSTDFPPFPHREKILPSEALGVPHVDHRHAAKATRGPHKFLGRCQGETLLLVFQLW